MTVNLEIPNTGSQNKEITFEKALFILGANGAGKTKLGSFLERNISSIKLFKNNKEIQDKVLYRITAQKIIQFPNSIAVGEKTECELYRTLINGYYSYDKQIIDGLKNKYHAFKGSFNQQEIFDIGSLNDYEVLLKYLFTTHTKITDQDRRRKEVSSEETELEKSISVWESIFKNREILKNGFELQSRRKGNSLHYPSSMMSDGERIAFYLVAKIITAPQNSIIIVDEPELHLNKSIVYPMWSKLINLRDDCAFIFMTHDIEFSSSFDYPKLWLKEFIGNDAWEYEVIQQDNLNIPEELILKIIGSRRNIIFVEGNHDSYDSRLYKKLFEDSLIIPVGSCENVIKYVSTINKNQNLLYNISVKGIIDRDRRSDREIEKLNENNIYTIPYAEVENILISDEIIRLICESNFTNEQKKDKEKEVKDHIKTLFRGQIDSQKREFIRDRIKYRLNVLDVSELELGKLENKINEIYNEAYQYTEDLFRKIDCEDYSMILMFFNRKSLIKECCKILGFINLNFYWEKILVLLQNEGNKNDIINSLNLSELRE